MNRQSMYWLGAAGAVVVIVVAVVLAFGITTAPEFPSLYTEAGPTVEGRLAYVEYGSDDCVHVLDVASGESHEVYCDDWLHLEGWDTDGHLRIHSGNGHDYVSVVNPATQEVVEWGRFIEGDVPPKPYPDSLRARSDDGRAILIHDGESGEKTLIDVTGPRDYAFWEYGITTDGNYAWVCDSEDRVLVVALDGSGGPWVVAEGVSQTMWE
ncbi:MAG: hypothetical protein QNJ77_07965 [Acidimicrobiia bacterium]|nr:hypothetical protein [Acidimicrobiia bacterium]